MRDNASPVLNQFISLLFRNIAYFVKIVCSLLCHKNAMQLAHSFRPETFFFIQPIAETKLIVICSATGVQTFQVTAV